MKATSAIPIREDSYKKKIGKITFVVTTFSNSCGSKTASELILKMLEERVIRGDFTSSRSETG